jgi:hypothetical protein
MSIFRAACNRMRPGHRTRARCSEWLSVFLRTDYARRCADEAGAMVFLNDNLSVEQRDQLRRFGYFEVVGGETKRRYRIRGAYRLNVEEVSATGTRIRLLCFGPAEGVALGRVMLAQKLALELFEREALAVANMVPRECPAAAAGRQNREPRRA